MSAPEVKADVRVVPARRIASFTVPLVLGEREVTVRATLQRSEVKIEWPSGRYYLPRSLASVDSMIAMLTAVRRELVEQGVES